MARVRVTLPNIISFTTLAIGLAAIAVAIEGNHVLAAAFILVGYITDALDGEVARRIRGSSEFGIQLDSLVDIVHFGGATSILLTRHLADGPLGGWPIWILVTLYMIAGAFRLARFNLTALNNRKESTMGLTISTSGAYLALVILVDLGFEDRLFADWIYAGILVLVSALMVSRIPFPELQAILKHRRFSGVAIGLTIVISFWLSFPVVWWATITGYITFGLLRAIARFIL